MFIISAIVILVLNICFDMAYIFRTVYAIGSATISRRVFGRKKDIFKENIRTGICLPTDLDFQLHMNNSRYLRECDFGRLHMTFELDGWNVLRSLDADFVAANYFIRFRRSLKLFDLFKIRTKFVCWDDKAFYMEQRIERSKDNFICAIVYLKIAIVRATPQQIVDKIMDGGERVVSPKIPAEFQKLIEANALSSDKLKKLL